MIEDLLVNMVLDSFGSVHYVAPELIEHKQYKGPEIDVWSLGVILYAMACGELPFSGKTEADIRRRIIHGTFKLPSHLTIELKQLIQSMLTLDPKQRISLEQAQYSSWMQLFQGHRVHSSLLIKTELLSLRCALQSTIS